MADVRSVARTRGAGSGVTPRGQSSYDEETEVAPRTRPAAINVANRCSGRLGDRFRLRFRLGRLIPGSPMPWQAFSRMDEDDLRAIYRYLKSVPPVKNDVGAPMVSVKK